jgi:hypothetical protein
LERARAEVEAAVQAGNQAAQAARDAAREQVAAARESTRLAVVDDAAPAPAPFDAFDAGAGSRPVEVPPEAVPARPAASTFDAALASAFGDAASASPVPEAKPEANRDAKAKPVVEFRTVDPGPGGRKRKARGPVVDLELSLARGIEPEEIVAEPELESAVAATGVDADVDAAVTPDASAPAERAPEVQAWRRTAMAELTALATDSDDLTPRRRK